MGSPGFDRVILVALLCGFSCPSATADVTAAVAANFAAPMKSIAAAFEQQTGHKVSIALGASGQFYAQIRQGAPFDVLLSADAEIPRKLEEENLAERGTRFTYAVGRLALWSKDPQLVDSKGLVLGSDRYQKLAIANAKLAPYGAAAREALQNLGLEGRLESRLVQGMNISQTFQFVSSGNANLGFVAWSQVFNDGKLISGSAWLVPEMLHSPIQQDAVLLKSAARNPAARALLNYLQSEHAREIISSYGYSHAP